jgi:cytochrome c
VYAARHSAHHGGVARSHSGSGLGRIAAFTGILSVFLIASSTAWESARQGADVEAGRQLFNNTCRTCHSIQDADNRLGPHLHAIIGRKAGALPNYGYSSALKEAGFTWDDETLDRFIANPEEMMPGNSMKPYGGMASTDSRAEVIAFLRSLSNRQ